MCKWIIFFLFAWLSIMVNANAVPMVSKLKYPYPLLTDDYDVLSENDLGGFTWGMRPRPFSVNEDSGGYNYWQCFPRENISITLEDSGESTEDFGWKDNVGDLKISVWVNSALIHEYEMRRAWTVGEFQERFNHWRKLMKGEKYVCLAGSFVDRELKTENGLKREIYGWIFEKMKTKKGCDSYFDNCNPTYQQYLKEEA